MTEDRFKELMARDYGHRPTAWECFKAAIKGQNVTVDFIRTTYKGLVKDIRITDQKDTELFEIGYKAGDHILQGWRYIFIGKKHTFARLHYFRYYDAKKMGNFETPSTLNDYFESSAEKEFRAHLSQVKLDPTDVRRIVIIVAGIVIGLGGYFILFGGF